MQVITEVDIVSVSDGAGRLAAHGCAAHDFIAGKTEVLTRADEPM